MKTDKKNISNSLNACAKPCIEPGEDFEPLPDSTEKINKKQFQQFLNACSKACDKTESEEKFEPVPYITKESGKLPVKETHPFKFVFYTTDKIVSKCAKLLDKITPGRKTVRVEFPSGIRRRLCVYPAGDICKYWKYFLVYRSNSSKQAIKVYRGKSVSDHIFFIIKYGNPLWSENVTRLTWENSVSRVWYFHKIAIKHNNWTMYQ